MGKEDIEKRILEIAELYDKVDTSDFQGMLLALETMSGEHYQDLYNKVATIIITKRIEKINDETMDYSSKVEKLKELEKEFECDIDYIDYHISFKYQ